MLRSTTRILRPQLTTAARSYSKTRPCYSFNHRRAFPSTSGSTSSQKPRLGKHSERKAEAPLILPENRCAHVTTWDMLRNPAEAFTLIQAIEQKYGPVESFVFKKDFDTPSTYQTRMVLTFKSVESFNRLPKDFEVLHIRMPKVQPKRPGGIGLDEIQPVLSNDVEYLTADQASAIGHKEGTIDFRIKRAYKGYYTQSPYTVQPLSEKYRKAVGSKMLQWGGFCEMEPIDSTRPITHEELKKGSLDHIYMRRTLREWAQVCGEPNNFELQPEQEEEPASVTPPVVEEEKEAEAKLEPEPIPEDWLTGVDEPRIAPDPIERILGMEDVLVPPDDASGSQPAVDSRQEEPTSIASEIPPDSSYDTTTSSTTPPATQREPSLSTFSASLHQLPTSLASPTVAEPSIATSSVTPTSSVPGSSSSIPDASLPFPEPPADSSEPPEPVFSQRGLQETGRLDGLDQEHAEHLQKLSSTQEKTPQSSTVVQDVKEVEAKEAEAEVKESSNSDLEYNPRFGGLYDKLQNIIRGS